jgi:hypothetical protein
LIAFNPSKRSDKMRFEELSPMAQAFLENVSAESHIVRMDFESKIGDHTSENAYLEAIVEYLESILLKPRNYLEILNLDGRVDLSYFTDAVHGFRTGVLQILSIPVSMRSWTKEDVD